MANTLRFKRGLASGIPTGVAGEPLFTTDTFDLYIGNGTTNTRFQKYIASGATTQILRGDGSLYTFPLAISSPSNGQVLKYNGTSWVNDSDAGITGSGLAGQVAYFTGATTQGGSNNLFWDNANGRLGIGTNVPDFSLSVTGQISIGGVGANLGIIFSQALITAIPSSSVKSQIANLNSGFGYAAGSLLLQPRTGVSAALVFASEGTEKMRLTSGGNFIINNSASDSGQRLQVTGDIYVNGSTASYIAQLNQNNTSAGASFGAIIRGGTNVSDTALRVQNAAQTLNLLTVQGNGSLGLGTTLLTGYNFRINKTITGSAVAYGIDIDSAIQSDVTTAAVIYGTSVGTQATTFTLSALFHYNATQGTLGAGSTVTSQYGFRVSSNMVGATNNYAYFGEIPSGTNRWNLYMNGTANNYMAGSLGIGTTGLSNTNLNITKNLTGNVNCYGVFNSGSIRSDVTTGAQMFTSAPSIQNAVFTLAGLKHFEAVGISSVGSATITTQFGFFVESTLSGATTNYGFYGNIAAATGRWNLFMDGTANNFMRGSLLVGTSTTSTGEALQVTGTAKITGAATFGSTVQITGNGTKINWFNSGYENWYAGTKVNTTQFVIGSGTNSEILTLVNSGAATFSSSVTAASLGVNVSTIRTKSEIAATLAAPTALNTNVSAGNLLLSDGGNIGMVMGLYNTSFDSYIQARNNLGANNVAYSLLLNPLGGNVSIGTNLVLTAASIEQNNASGLTLNASNASGAILFRTAGSERMSIAANGNLAVDSNVLFVDAVNNEVGIGTTAPNSSLHVVGSITKSISDVKTANYTATATDHTILCSAAGGGFTITLPAASGITGRIYVIKKTNASSGVNSVTVDGNGSETIDGSASINLACRSSVTLQCDGSNWHILSLYSDTLCL